METRPYGKTGESFPILSFGGQRIVDEHDCTEAEAIEIVNTAIDRGIRYFDSAWIYSQHYSQGNALLPACFGCRTRDRQAYPPTAEQTSGPDLPSQGS